MSYALLLLALSTTSALAQEAVMVGVVGAHDAAMAPAAQEELSRVLVDAIDAVPGLDGLAPNEVGQRLLGRKELVIEEALLTSGRARLDEGRALYQQAQLQAAAETLEDAAGLLAAELAYTRKAADLWDAWMLLAAVELSRDGADAAKRAVRSAIAVAPARRVDPIVFPPSVVALHAAEREASMANAGTLTVESVSGDARAWLDGVELGDTPATAAEVPPGPHVLAIHQPNGDMASEQVALGPRQEVTTSLAAAAPRLGVAAESGLARRQQMAALYRSVGSRAALDVVVLVGRTDDLVQVQLYIPGSDAFSTPRPVGAMPTPETVGAAVLGALEEVDELGRLKVSAAMGMPLSVGIDSNATLARVLLAQDISVASTAVVSERPSRRPARTPRTGSSDKKLSPLVWVGIGVGAAAVAGGVATAVALSNNGGTPSGTVVLKPVFGSARLR